MKGTQIHWELGEWLYSCSENASCNNLKILLYQKISGEVFEVDSQMLEFLDYFEEVPTLYERTNVDVVIESGEALKIDYKVFKSCGNGS